MTQSTQRSLSTRLRDHAELGELAPLSPAARRRPQAAVAQARLSARKAVRERSALLDVESEPTDQVALRDDRARGRQCVEALSASCLTGCSAESL